MQTFFGPRWDAPAFEDATEVPVPVGEPCGYCEVAITADDRGGTMVFGYADGTHAVQPYHLGCFLRALLGDVEHLNGRCSCYGGTGHDERPLYEQGQAVLEHQEAL